MTANGGTTWDEDRLLDQARAATGLGDFGDDAFREGLGRLVWSLEHEADLPDLGVAILGEIVAGSLRQRLQIEDWYRRHPEIDDEPIREPLVGLGLPRTGSSALSALIAEDPRTRSFANWQTVDMCPPPSTVPAPDPRLALTAERQELQKQAAPRAQALLPITVTGPAECQSLLQLNFASPSFAAMAPVPTYARWLLYEADMRPTYAYERRTLKLLQWGLEPLPWRLKCPNHLLWLDAFDEVFPDARFWWTHRDPSEVLVSVADLYMEVGAMFGSTPDRVACGAYNLEQWDLAMARGVAWRDDDHDDRFFDLEFRAVQRDPIGEVTALYRWLGQDVSSEFESNMRQWWAEHAASRSENVHPDPAVFGLDPDELRARFARYTARAERWCRRDDP